MMQGSIAAAGGDDPDDGDRPITLSAGLMGLDLGARAMIAADIGGLLQQDPEKDAAVKRIKNFQRKGRAEVDAWHEWCGTKRDPARHSADKLKEFIAKYCVPEIDS